MAPTEDDLQVLAATVHHLQQTTDYLLHIYTEDPEVDVIYLRGLANKAARAASSIATNCDAVLRDVEGRGARLDGQVRLDLISGRHAEARQAVDRFGAAVDTQDARRQPGHTKERRRAMALQILAEALDKDIAREIVQRHAAGRPDITDLLPAAKRLSSGEKVLFEGMVNLMDYTTDAPLTLSRAINLGDRFGTALARALAIWHGGKPLSGP